MTEPLTRVERAQIQQDLRDRLCGAVLSAWLIYQRRTGVPENWLAKRLGRNKSNLNKSLKSPETWSLDTIAEILAVIGADIEFDIVWKD